MSKQRERVKRILDWEELERAPNTHGAFSFLRSAAEIVSIRKNDVPPESVALLSEAFVIDKTTTVVTPDTVADQSAKMSKSRPYKVHHCTLVQHGQSLGETTLYQALWTHGRTETSETRTITAGWRTMKRLCGMTDKNCKHSTISLIEKLAIEEIGREDVHSRTGRTYRIYSFTKTLERRKAAGLEWAVWDKGRRFVQRDGSPLNGDSCPKDKTTTVVAATPVDMPAEDKTAPGTVVKTTPGTVVKTTPVLGSSLGIQERNKSPSSKDVTLILEALGEEAFVADEQAALQLIHSCRNFCPDATADEVVGIIREKGAVMQARRDVRNPIGFLLTSVASVFEGEGIKGYRRHQIAAAALAERRSQEEKRKENEVREWFLSERDRLTRVLEDSSQSEWRKDSARTMLAEVEVALNRSQEEVR
jgi:hypothetical protein